MNRSTYLCINHIENIGLPKSCVQLSTMVGLGRFLRLFTAWYYDDGSLFKLYTARSCLGRITGRKSNRQGAGHDRWHAPYSTGWEVWIFSASFSFGIVRLSLSGLAAVERNECMVSVRVIHFGFLLTIWTLYIFSRGLHNCGVWRMQTRRKVVVGFVQNGNFIDQL